jgi:probable rRNA maturation factor
MMLEIDIESDEEWDSSTDWPLLVRKAAEAAVAESAFPQLAESGRAVELSVRLTSDEDVRALNAHWRGKDKPTNVLSFPMVDEASLGGPAEPMIGDIVLAHGICSAEADEKRVPIETHASHLMVHGTLHLLGYDHETTDEDAELMEETERKALASIGIADPYKVTEVQP